MHKVIPMMGTVNRVSWCEEHDHLFSDRITDGRLSQVVEKRAASLVKAAY